MGTLARGTSSAEVQGLPTGRSEEILASTSGGTEADGAALLSGHPPAIALWTPPCKANRGFPSMLV